MKKAECKEQLQQDIVGFLDGMDNEIVAHVCELVISNIDKMEESPENELNNKLEQIRLAIDHNTQALGRLGHIIRQK